MTAEILVVDDSPLERLLVEALLTRNANYYVDLAEDGKQALNKIAAAPPNLIVTDLFMPEMDGLELVRRVRRQYPDIPVILMTAFGDEATAVDSLEAGAASYVPKSKRAERLVETVGRVLEHAAAQLNHERLGLIETLMDEVSYNSDGNELTMRKQIPLPVSEESVR